MCFVGAILLLVVIAVPIRSAEEPPVFVVTWDATQTLKEVIRRAAEEGPDHEALLALVRERGGELCQYEGEVMRLDAAVQRYLAATDGAEDFLRYVEPIARRRLDESGNDAAALRAVAEGFPGSVASREAWQRIADRDWDRGRFRRYLVAADRAGEADHPVRRTRFAAAYELIAAGTRPRIPLPADESWHRASGWRASAAPVIAADGGSFAFIDDEAIHVLSTADGSEQGRLSLGDGQRGQPPRLASAADGGFVAILPRPWNSAELVGIRPDGSPAFRRELALGDRPAVVGMPTTVDGAVVLAWKYIGTSGRMITIGAYEQADGEPRWQIGTGLNDLKDTRALYNGYNSDLPPDVQVHGGRLVVLGNDGLLALLDLDGGIRRLWSYQRFVAVTRYRTTTGRRRTFRPGVMATTGPHLAAAPADSSQLLVLSADERLTVYEGPGSLGTLLGCADGLAFLADRELVAVDLATCRVAWQVPLADEPVVGMAAIGCDRLLLGEGNDLVARSLADGRETGRLAVAAEATVAVADGLLLVRDHCGLTAWR